MSIYAEEKPIIAVVDANTEVLDLVSAYLKPKGFQVVAVNDIESVLLDLESHVKTWSLALLDLPSTNKLVVNLLTEIKKLNVLLPIINLKEEAPQEKNASSGLLTNSSGETLVPPFDFQRLIKLINKHLDTKKIKISPVVNSNGNIIGVSPVFVASLNLAKQVAKSNSNVFITGESGTGKELFARYVHANSLQSKGPFVAINCSSIPENLLESELFGHCKGAFTGAVENKTGLFEEAQNGTFFLDEIGDLSLSLQAKLLRVLQDRKIKKVGENQYKPINCRIISATHKTLSAEVKEKRFREDLYFRIHVIPLAIPALRDRPEDLMPLAEYFLKKFAKENNSPTNKFSKEAKNYLMKNKWRGNVRELENTIERAVVLCTGQEIELENFLPNLNYLKANSERIENFDSENEFVVQYSEALPTLDYVILKYVEFAVKKNNGAKDKTAKEIDIDRKTLYKKMKSNEQYNQFAN